MIETSVMEDLIVIVKVAPFYVSIFLFKPLFLNKFFANIFLRNHFFLANLIGCAEINEIWCQRKYFAENRNDNMYFD